MKTFLLTAACAAALLVAAFDEARANDRSCITLKEAEAKIHELMPTAVMLEKTDFGGQSKDTLQINYGVDNSTVAVKATAFIDGIE